MVLKVKSKFLSQASMPFKTCSLWLYSLSPPAVACILAISDHMKLWKLAMAAGLCECCFSPPGTCPAPTRLQLAISNSAFRSQLESHVFLRICLQAWQRLTSKVLLDLLLSQSLR